MGIMRNSLLKTLKEELNIPILETKGYITKFKRHKYGVSKSHINDARCISNNINVILNDTVLNIKALRHQNRQIHKMTILKGGKRKNNQLIGPVKGFNLWDKVLYNNKEFIITGRRKTGFFSIKNFNEKISINSISSRKLKLIEHSQNYIIERSRRLGV